MKKTDTSKNILGELESDVMEAIWKLKKASVREVLLYLEKKRKVAYTTVMTVMFRLYNKGILKRKPDGSGAYIYIPVHKNEKEFVASVSMKAINNLIGEFGELAVSQFVDVIENSDKKNFKQWRKRLRKVK